MTTSTQIILASASPRRRQLLDQIGVRYRIEAADIDETVHSGETPECYVSRMAAQKSAIIRERVGSHLPVLGADTAVVLGDEILGKPDDQAHAVAMLEKLSATRHCVLSAVSVRGQQHVTVLSMTKVWFRSIDSEEILNYWQTQEPCGKAGAYAIQGKGALFVEKIEGSFSGVVGLPLYETAELLKQVGVSV